MKLPVVLAVFVGIFALACSGASSSDEGLLERAKDAYKHVDGSES